MPVNHLRFNIALSQRDVSIGLRVEFQERLSISTVEPICQWRTFHACTAVDPIRKLTVLKSVVFVPKQSLAMIHQKIELEFFTHE